MAFNLRTILKTVANLDTDFRGYGFFRDTPPIDAALPRICYRCYEMGDDPNIEGLDTNALELTIEFLLDAEEPDNEEKILTLRNRIEQIDNLDCGDWTVTSALVQDFGHVGTYQYGVSSQYFRDNVMCKLHLRAS